MKGMKKDCFSFISLFDSFFGDNSSQQRVAYYQRLKEAKQFGSAVATTQRGYVPFDSIFASPSSFNVAEAPGNPVTVSQGLATAYSQSASSSFPAQTQSELRGLSLPVGDDHSETEADPFAEYFSDSADGSISVPEWITQKYFQPASEDSSDCVVLSDDDVCY